MLPSLLRLVLVLLLLVLLVLLLLLLLLLLQPMLALPCPFPLPLMNCRYALISTAEGVYCGSCSSSSTMESAGDESVLIAIFSLDAKAGSTWKVTSIDSFTLIIAPALSNSPQYLVAEKSVTRLRPPKNEYPVSIYIHT
jgi:hypothetical protein